MRRSTRSPSGPTVATWMRRSVAVVMPGKSSAGSGTRGSWLPSIAIQTPRPRPPFCFPAIRARASCARVSPSCRSTSLRRAPTACCSTSASPRRSSTRPRRGFSFMRDGPLDMRMDPDHGTSAAAFLAGADEREIADVIARLGEERHARRIARAIVAARASGTIETTGRLAGIVAAAVPGREPGRTRRRAPSRRCASTSTTSSTSSSVRCRRRSVRCGPAGASS